MILVHSISSCKSAGQLVMLLLLCCGSVPRDTASKKQGGCGLPSMVARRSTLLVDPCSCSSGIIVQDGASFSSLLIDMQSTISDMVWIPKVIWHLGGRQPLITRRFYFLSSNTQDSDLSKPNRSSCTRPCVPVGSGA